MVSKQIYVCVSGRGSIFFTQTVAIRHFKYLSCPHEWLTVSIREPNQPAKLKNVHQSLLPRAVSASHFSLPFQLSCTPWGGASQFENSWIELIVWRCLFQFQEIWHSLMIMRMVKYKLQTPVLMVTNYSNELQSKPWPEISPKQLI